MPVFQAPNVGASASDGKGEKGTRSDSTSGTSDANNEPMSEMSLRAGGLESTSINGIAPSFLAEHIWNAHPMSWKLVELAPSHYDVALSASDRDRTVHEHVGQVLVAVDARRSLK